MTICNCNQGRLPCTCCDERFEELPQVEYASEVAVRRGRQLETAWAEVHSLGVRVQVLKAVAIIGWAAAILLALGV